MFLRSKNRESQNNIIFISFCVLEGKRKRMAKASNEVKGQGLGESLLKCVASLGGSIIPPFPLAPAVSLVCAQTELSEVSHLVESLIFQ